MSTGDFLLYISAVAGVLSIAAIAKGIEGYARRSIAAFTGALTLAFLLLVYYFVSSDFAISYVWSYSSLDLPLFYKLTGVLAGQQGTILFWGFLVSVFSFWLSQRSEFSSSMRRALLIAIVIALCFVALAILDSPFTTIYEQYNLPETQVPEDGNGLNPLLIDPWMAAHPPLMFIAYAAMALPFALAMVYLFESSGKNSASYKEWAANATLWCRISWLFLTLGIAVGGFWSYKVLGWGGFWAWDPVETSSLVPWLLLTGTLHALAEHRHSEQRYAILAPVLTALSFVLVLYATLVTRSGFFESIHAFGSGETGRYLAAMIAISFIATLALAANKYLRSSEPPAGSDTSSNLASSTEAGSQLSGQQPEAYAHGSPGHVPVPKVAEVSSNQDETSFVNRTNIFYAAILLFCILTFVSFWGITFPALIKFSTGSKYGVGSSFFNIWSYPFFIALMLLAGLGLSYKPAQKEKSVKTFAAFAALTILAAFLKPYESLRLLDYSAVVTAEKPWLYEFIGSLSALSFLPPSFYLLLSSFERGAEKLKAVQRAKKIKGAGVVIIHAGVALITLGAIFSVLLTSEFSVNFAPGQELAAASLPPYSAKLLGYDVNPRFGHEIALPSGILSVGELYAKADSLSAEDFVIVRGLSRKVQEFNSFRIVTLSGDDRLLFVVTGEKLVPVDVELVVGGSIHRSNSSEDLLLLAERIATTRKLLEVVQEVNVEVYEGSSKIGEGSARVINYENGENKRVMIDRGIFRDVYVIFTGVQEGSIPLTVKLIPFVNYLWLGILMLAAGIIAILVSGYFKETRK